MVILKINELFDLFFYMAEVEQHPLLIKLSVQDDTYNPAVAQDASLRIYEGKIHDGQMVDKKCRHILKPRVARGDTCV